jgi:hypothetical protein
MEGDISPDEKGTFLFVHTAGVHVPILFNRHGEQLPKANNSDAGCIESGIFVLRQLGRLLDDYRKRNIFDKSLIIVLADHGHHGGEWADWHGAESAFPGNGRPFLWVKPPYCNHPFTASGAPTSHAKLFALLGEACNCELSDCDIQHFLSAEDRVYRCEANSVWHDYHVASDNTWRVEIVAQGETDSAKMRPIQLGKFISLTFNRTQIRERGIIRFRGFPPKQGGGFLGWKPVWTPLQKQISLDFKVEPVSNKYRVLLVGNVQKKLEIGETPSRGCIRISANGKAEQSVQVYDEGVKEVVLHEVVPNEDGIIELVGERDDGCQLEIVFTHLRITQHAL